MTRSIQIEFDGTVPEMLKKNNRRGNPAFIAKITKEERERAVGLIIEQLGRVIPDDDHPIS